MLIHKGTQTMETDRLFLRRFRIADAQDMFQIWVSDPEVSRYQSWTAHKSIVFTYQLLYKWIKAYDNVGTYLWAIVLKEFGHPVGSISLNHVDSGKALADVGYCVGRRFWRRGIATEALAAVLKFAFGECGFEKITARCEVENAASGSVLKKCGFQFKGKQEELKDRDRTVVCACYALTKEEWEKFKQ